VFWASWGGSGKEPGSGNRVPGTSSGNRIGFRWVPTGFAVLRFRFRRLRERGFEGSEGLDSIYEVLTEPFLETGFQEPEVWKRFRAKFSNSYFLLRKYILVLRKYIFVLRNYAFVCWKYFFAIWKCILIRWKYISKVYFYILIIYFCIFSRYIFIFWRKKNIYLWIKYIFNILKISFYILNIFFFIFNIYFWILKIFFLYF